SVCWCLVCALLSVVSSVCHSSHLPFFFNDAAPTEIYPLSLHDALPIFALIVTAVVAAISLVANAWLPGTYESMGVFLALIVSNRSEEHTSELQSRENLVCRLLLEKKKKTTQKAEVKV